MTLNRTTGHVGCPNDIVSLAIARDGVAEARGHRIDLDDLSLSSSSGLAADYLVFPLVEAGG
jgi:hypothetical protein